MSKEKEKPKTSELLIVVFILILFAAISSLSSGNSASNSNSISNKQSLVAKMTAVEQMEIAFNGGYSKNEIREKISKAMRLYGVQLTEENYSRAGSALVVLRKEYGVDEMVVLDYMIRSYIPDVKMTFPQMAAWSVTAITQGLE